MKRRDFLSNASAVVFLPAIQPLGVFADQYLNVKNVEEICDELLPPENKLIPGEHDSSDFEDYEFLLSDLKEEGIHTTSQLRKFIKDTLPIALERDKKTVADKIRQGEITKRLGRGVFYLHVGLVRTCLNRYGGVNSTNKSITLPFPKTIT